MSGRPWSDDDFSKLDTLFGRFSPKIVASQLGRSERAVLIKGCAMRKEQRRVDAARKLLASRTADENVSRLTMATEQAQPR